MSWIVNIKCHFLYLSGIIVNDVEIMLSASIYRVFERVMLVDIGIKCCY